MALSHRPTKLTAALIVVTEGSYFQQIINVFKKSAILKKGIGIESENVCKQDRDQIARKHVGDTAQGLLENGNEF